MSVVATLRGPYEGGVRYGSQGERIGVIAMASIPVVMLLFAVGGAFDANTDHSIGAVLLVFGFVMVGLAVTVWLLGWYC